MNAQWADVEDYILRGMYVDAGISIGNIVKELVPEDADLDEIADSLSNGIMGELY